MSTDTSLAIRRVSLPMAIAVLMVGLGSGPGPAEKTTLRWKFKEGDVLRYSMDQTTVSTGLDPINGGELKQTLGLILDMTWTVKSVDASGVATMTQRIDRVRGSAAAAAGKFSFDSKEAGDSLSIAGPLLRMLVGAEFTSKLSPRGDLTEIKLSDKLLATLRGNDEPIGAQGQFSEEGLKNMLSQMVFPLSEMAVEVGETWRRTLVIPSGPDGQTRPIEQTFTYQGPESATPGLESIEFSNKAEPPKPDPNIPVTLKKESATGRVRFDNAAGRLIRSNTAETVEMSFQFQGREIPQKVETTRVMTLSQDKAP